jgi:hypothetical protein
MIQEGSDRGTSALVRSVRRVAVRRNTAAAREASERRRHRRERVGLVLHLVNDDF